MPEANRFHPVVIAPTFNNARTLMEVLRRVDQIGLPIIVVNDGSTDGTAAILEAWKQAANHQAEFHPLAYLRSLEIVDKNNIGLEGHSMGGWTVLAAATAMPNDYKSMVLEGSSTGKPFAADGTPNWPRNTALVFAQYDEFSNLTWGGGRAGARRDSKPKTPGDVRHPGSGCIRQGLW